MMTKKQQFTGWRTYLHAKRSWHLPRRGIDPPRIKHTPSRQ